MRHIALALGLLLSPPQLSQAELLFEFTFNDAGPTTQMTERSALDWTLSFQNQDGSPADLHGSLGSGVSGQPFDRAFDNTASTGMGSGESGGRATVATASLPECQSFTLSGWLRTAAVPIGGFARIFYWDATDQIYGRMNGVLRLAVNSEGVNSEAAFLPTNEWVFFAATYDGTLTQDNVRFYHGSLTQPVTAGAPQTLPAGALQVGGGPFTIGNNSPDSTPTQPFDGWLDNFRMHGGTGHSGLLALAELESLRAADAQGTAPSLRVRTSLEWMPPSIAAPSQWTIVSWTIPGYRHQLQQSNDFTGWNDVLESAFDGDGAQHEWKVPLSATPTFYRLKTEPLP